MRRVASFLLVAGLVVFVAPRAHAAPTSNDPKTAARDAAAWLASQVNDQGFVPSPTDPNAPNLSVTVQAVPALASAGVGKAQVDAMLDYLGQHIDDYVIQNGEIFPGAIANLILGARAAGQDPTAFGSPPENLVDRLLATQQPNGLFGSADPTFDGAFRQGLSLLALAAVGQTDDDAAAWLEDQQCADGLWTPFRADTSQPCPAPDPVNFVGPDTNSTAAAMLGLTALGHDGPAHTAADALKNARTTDGGWGFIVTGEPSDSSSTGLVLEALRTLEGTTDSQGLDALLALQVGCDADTLDRGGIAFQPGAGGELAPDGYSTSQAVAAVAEVALPVTDATIATDVPTPCATPATTVPVTVAGATSTTMTPATTAAVATTEELPFTGSSTGVVALVGVLAGATGFALVAGARRRRH